MEKIFKNKTGITLIALVITIIILLILAGVTIATLTGDNGILNNAGKAKEETEQAEEDELRRLTALEAATNFESREYVDIKGNKIKIPAKCAVSKVNGENIVDEGLVIIDENANEWVWIPCTESEFSSAEDSWKKDDPYLEREWTDNQSTEIGLKSIKENGGFYIARYEAGVPEYAYEIYATTIEGDFENKRLQRLNSSYADKYTPLSQKGQQAWSTTKQVDAKKLAEKMLNNETVQSYLIDSYAWNATCRVIENKTGKSITDSSAWGNYYDNITTNYTKIETMFAIYKYINGNWEIPKTINYGFINESPKIDETALELATGASKDFKAYNIYDLAGNMWEWTTEESSDGRAVIRGGSFRNPGKERAVTMMNGDNSKINDYAYNVSFRAILYLQ